MKPGFLYLLKQARLLKSKPAFLFDVVIFKISLAKKANNICPNWLYFLLYLKNPWLSLEITKPGAHAITGIDNFFFINSLDESSNKGEIYTPIMDLSDLSSIDSLCAEVKYRYSCFFRNLN